MGIKVWHIFLLDPVFGYLFCTMEEDEPTFETADAGAAHTFPQPAGDLRKGSHVMIKGHPCKVAEVTSSKTGKHGHAKCHIVALDIFTQKKYEDLCPAGHTLMFLSSRARSFS